MNLSVLLHLEWTNRLTPKLLLDISIKTKDTFVIFAIIFYISPITHTSSATIQSAVLIGYNYITYTSKLKWNKYYIKSTQKIIKYMLVLASFI